MAAKKNRAPELDFLRGLALVLMLIQHIGYDLRYEFNLPVFGILETNWFWAFLHPFILVLFVGVSGICSTFSNNNFKRGFKLLAVALGLTVATFIVTRFLGINCLIIFNVLHLLAISILLYAVVQYIEKKAKIRPAVTNMILGFIGIYITAVGSTIEYMNNSTGNLLFLPVGFNIKNAPLTADSMKIFPWMGVFFIGCVFGRVCYPEKKSLVPANMKKLHTIGAPLEFMGRHSLIIYLAHQPIVYGILFLIFLVLGKIR